MKIFISALGQREFIVFEDLFSIPIDDIAKIDLDFRSGNAATNSNSVCLFLKNQEKIVLPFEKADAIREFLIQNKIEYLNEQYVELTV